MLLIFRKNHEATFFLLALFTDEKYDKKKYQKQKIT